MTQIGPSAMPAVFLGIPALHNNQDSLAHEALTPSASPHPDSPVNPFRCALQQRVHIAAAQVSGWYVAVFCC
jgi:hypothetical protein